MKKLLITMICLIFLQNLAFAQQQYVLYPNNQYVIYPYVYQQPTYIIQSYPIYIAQPYYYQYNYTYGHYLTYPQQIINYDDRIINSYPVYYRVEPRRFFNYSHFYRY